MINRSLIPFQLLDRFNSPYDAKLINQCENLNNLSLTQKEKRVENEFVHKKLFFSPPLFDAENCSFLLKLYVRIICMQNKS